MRAPHLFGRRSRSTCVAVAGRGHMGTGLGDLDEPKEEKGVALERVPMEARVLALLLIGVVELLVEARLERVEQAAEVGGGQRRSVLEEGRDGVKRELVLDGLGRLGQHVDNAYAVALAKRHVSVRRRRLFCRRRRAHD